MRYGQNCKDGKCGSGNSRRRSHGWKMQEWKKQEQITGVENAGVENAKVDSRSGKCRSKSYGTPNRDYFERILSYLNLVR